MKIEDRIKELEDRLKMSEQMVELYKQTSLELIDENLALSERLVKHENLLEVNNLLGGKLNK